MNRKYIVEWFGCGCPKNVDEYGNVLPDFNANDFTKLFWFFVSCIVVLISVLLSRLLLKYHKWHRLVYIALIIVISFLISYNFVHRMMWL